MKQYDITVKIRVTVDAVGDRADEAYKIASQIADDYSNMAMKYSSIGADEIIRVDIEEV